jgi:hypothetical protein
MLGAASGSECEQVANKRMRRKRSKHRWRKYLKSLSDEELMKAAPEMKRERGIRALVMVFLVLLPGCAWKEPAPPDDNKPLTFGVVVTADGGAYVTASDGTVLYVYADRSARVTDENGQALQSPLLEVTAGLRGGAYAHDMESVWFLQREKATRVKPGELAGGANEAAPR